MAVSRSRHQNEAIAGHLIVQPGRHAKRTVDQGEPFFLDSIPWFWHTAARLYAQPPFCHVTQLRLRGNPGPRDQANM